jgi:hypothetical protein
MSPLTEASFLTFSFFFPPSLCLSLPPLSVSLSLTFPPSPPPPPRPPSLSLPLPLPLPLFLSGLSIYYAHPMTLGYGESPRSVALRFGMSDDQVSTREPKP